MADTELDAMAAVLGALDPLDPAARERVLRWAGDKFEMALGAPSAPSGRTSSGGEVVNAANNDFREVGDLVHAAQPSNGPENALVVAYWFQEVQGRDGWTGADINSTLTNMGSRLANV